MTSATPTSDAEQAAEPPAGPDPPGGPDTPARRRNGPGRFVDVAVCAGYVLAAVLIMHDLLAHPATRVLALNRDDQALNEWLLALGPRFWTGDLHLVTYLLNVPDGVNLMSNASILALGLLLSPVTAVFGAPVSFAVVLTGNLAGTAVAWYLLLSRTLRLRRPAAATGAAFCGYAPGMIAQSNAHPHMTAQWLVPVIVWALVALARPGRSPAAVVATGALLGLAVAVQVFVGEEVLYLTAATLGLFVLAYALMAPGRARRAVPGLALGTTVALGVALVLLAYPLAVQFAGPQHVPNGPFSPIYFGADLRSFWTTSALDYGGSSRAYALVSSAAEGNAFFGVPLLVVIVAAAAWQWRRPAVAAAVLAGLVLAALSLGPVLTVGGRPTGHAGPYHWIASVPLLDSALPTRLGLPLIPVFGLVLATTLDRARRDDRRVVRIVAPLVVALGLVTVVPKPLPTADRPAVPAYFTGGSWRSCVRPGGTLVPVPPPNATDPDAMRWAAATDDRFALPEGFFIGPYAKNRTASVGVYPRPTSQLLGQVRLTGQVPPIGPDERARARDDAAYWHTSCLVLGDTQLRAAALRRAVDRLYGPGRRAAGVTVWRLAG